MPLISLCQIEGNPPLGQLSAWSTVNCVPQMHGRAGVVASTCISGIMHHRMPLCGGQTNVQLLVGLTARSMLLSLRQALQVGCCLISWRGWL